MLNTNLPSNEYCDVVMWFLAGRLSDKISYYEDVNRSITIYDNVFIIYRLLATKFLADASTDRVTGVYTGESLW